MRDYLEEAGTATEVWLNLLERLRDFGRESNPRGLKIIEQLAWQTAVDMHYPVVRVPGRQLGWRFLAAEAWWILMGKEDVASIAPYSKEISKFSDDGEYFFGAYGPMIEYQLDYVVNKLLEDSDSRQAVLNIWRENPPATKDVPCTLSLQFLIRDRKLHCAATMRSSDAWLGWVYDVFNFTMISAMVLLKLRNRWNNNEQSWAGAEYEPIPVDGLGNLYLTMGSSHLYEKHWKPVQEILAGTQLKYQIREDDPPPFEPLKLWSNGVELLPVDLKCAADDDGGAASEFVKWFRLQKV
jgi:thymidylate synthase